VVSQVVVVLPPFPPSDDGVVAGCPCFLLFFAPSLRTCFPIAVSFFFLQLKAFLRQLLHRVQAAPFLVVLWVRVVFFFSSYGFTPLSTHSSLSLQFSSTGLVRLRRGRTLPDLSLPRGQGISRGKSQKGVGQARLSPDLKALPSDSF